MNRKIRSLILIIMLSASTTGAQAALVVGGEVEVIVHSITQFIAAGIGLGLIAPTAPGPVPPKFVFPIIGGDTATGIFELDGGIIFDDGTNTLVVTNFVVNLPAMITTVDTSINGDPIVPVVRSDNFNCAAMVHPCFDVDGVTPLDDAAFTGSFFSPAAMAKFEEAFPGNTIDFGAMLADVSTITSLVVVPVPGVAVLFGLGSLIALGRRQRQV